MDELHVQKLCLQMQSKRNVAFLSSWLPTFALNPPTSKEVQATMHCSVLATSSPIVLISISHPRKPWRASLWSTTWSRIGVSHQMLRSVTILFRATWGSCVSGGRSGPKRKEIYIDFFKRRSSIPIGGHPMPGSLAHCSRIEL